ncbi:MAG: hypothetical protein HDQ88_01535 [Clostridia bacterium]|nr:hypothetical protein [Clostridia bacterium]
MQEKEEKPVDAEAPVTTTKIYFYIAIVALGLGAVAFGLSFTVLGIYALISSIILELASLSFSTTQKKKNNFPAVKYIQIVTYALLIGFTVFFIGGLIYSAV